MSDGDKEIRRDNAKNTGSLRSEGGDAFARYVARVAGAQVCESVSFHGSRRSSLDTLADVLIRYIQDLGKASTFYANIASRTMCSEFDVIRVLGDLESTHGFLGASDVQRCLVGSGVVRDLIRFVKTTEENPFSWPIPSFPVAQKDKQIQSFAQSGSAHSCKHIPDWLPAFPEPYTYVHTPVWNERTKDLKADKLEQVKQRRKAEKSLISLQQRLASYGTIGASVPAVNGDFERGKQVVCSSNPFLAQPLPFGVKQVTEIVTPDEAVHMKMPSIIETFAPAIEAAKYGTLDSGINEKKIIIGKRRVNFRLGIEKKTIASTLSCLGSLNSKKDLFLSRDDEKDDKKRRVEMILKEAMEKPDGLTQL